MPPSTDALTAQILTTLSTTTPFLPTPSTSFIRTLVLSRPVPPPLPSLVATARARILAADLTTTTTSSSSSSPFDQTWLARSTFPTNPPLLATTTRETVLRRDVTVQVLDVEDLSGATWEAVQALEAVERGETRRGREIIRLRSEDGGDGVSFSASSTAAAAVTDTRESQNQTTTTTADLEHHKKPTTHRLTIQDAHGTTAYALELVWCAGRIGIGTTTHIGEKIVLRAGTVVARRTVLLVPERTVFLGGRVEPWERAWVAGRLARLRAELEEKRGLYE